MTIRIYKIIPLILFLTSINLTSTGQKYLGQTKSYIITDKKECHIEFNKGNEIIDVLIMECSGFTQVFAFNPFDNNLCDIWGNEFPIESKTQLLKEILKGSTFIKSGETLLPSQCKSNLGTKYVEASIYERDGARLTVFDSDYCGLTNGDKFYVVVETYPHKN